MKKMLKNILWLLMLNSLFANAQGGMSFDMGEITCNQVDLTHEKDACMILFWLDGYVSAKEDDTQLSEEWIEELAGYIKEGCSENSNAKILDIIHEKYLDD